MTVKLTLLLPVRDNDGSDLDSAIKATRSALFDKFQGWTREGTVVGAYRMANGALKVDASEKYVVIVDESGILEVEGILRAFKARTTQEAMYLEIQRAVEIRFV
jgi:hypothetical protein